MAQDQDVASRQEARPQTEVSDGANLLEEIRYRIWFNTGCSDDAAEGAAAAVYDIFLDHAAPAKTMRDALVQAHAILLMLTDPSTINATTAQHAWERAVSTELSVRRALQPSGEPA